MGDDPQLVESHVDIPDGVLPLMSLPLELRLKIYCYLLPPRTHKIVTVLPSHGLSYYYNTSIHSLPSTYPFGRTPPVQRSSQTYKLLTANFRSEFPSFSIYPQILHVSKQIKAEAESILYGAREVRWDFGIFIEAVKAFWDDRSEAARCSVKQISIARAIPWAESGNGKGLDEKWIAFIQYLRNQLPNLKHIDLTIWSLNGSVSSFPMATTSRPRLLGDWEMDEVDEERKKDVQRWSEWEWTHDLLQLENLRSMKVTWWGLGEGDRQHGVDSWVMGRMVGDRVVRERMIREGIVVEGEVVLPGLDA